MHSDRTSQLQRCLDLANRGQSGAYDELVALSCRRLKALTRTYLSGDRLRRWAESDDVLQESLLRIRAELREVRLTTVRDFLRFSAFHIQRELKRLARHYYGPLGVGANHASDPLPESNGHGWASNATGRDTSPPALVERAEQLERLQAAIELLPQDLRDVVELLWLHGMSSAEAAEALGVTDRTIRNRWVRARLALHSALAENVSE